MSIHSLESEELVALEARVETSLVNIVLPAINVAVPTVTQINTGVQIATLSDSLQQMGLGNLAGVGVGQG